jgi:hypothetical protein
MQFYQKMCGDHPQEIINLASVSFVSTEANTFVIILRLFHEEEGEQIYWKYDDAIQFDREYTRLCKALDVC